MRCIIVAGMHRSGTSAVTRVVNLLGADIARELMPPAPANNETGFWEPIAVTKIHDRLLKELASSWDDPFPLPDRWTETDTARLAKGCLADEIKRDFSDSSLFVVKDPRITRLLPMWLEILDELAIEPIVVVPVRNPLEIAASLEARDRFPLAKSLLLYAHSYLETELETRERQRFFVRYDQLLDDWRPFAARLELVLGSSLDASSDKRAAEIEGFLTGELRHHHYSRADLSQTHDIAATVVEMFDRMSTAADGGAETELRLAFDRLRQTLSEATRLYRGLVMTERAMARAEIVHVREDRDAAKARATAEITVQHADIERLQAELDSTHEQAAASRAVTAAQTVEMTRLQAKLGSARVQTAQLLADLAATREQLAERQQGLDTRTMELADAREQVAELRDAVEARSREVVRLGSELAAARHRVGQSEASAEAVSQVLTEIQRSTVWRLTGPIRLIGSRMTWIRRRTRQLIKVIHWAATWRLPSEIRRRLRLRRDHRLIAASGLFDDEWYLDRYPDLRGFGCPPAVHYLQHGAREGRYPNPLFDSRWYCDRYPDVNQTGTNPLVHYLRHGAAEGRNPNPLFDGDWYLGRYPDVREKCVNPLVHYLHSGASEGRDPNPFFDTDWYLAHNTDVRASGVNPLVHYLSNGAAEGRDPSPRFGSDWYLARNVDVGAAGLNPLVHFLTRGIAEGRFASVSPDEPRQTPLVPLPTRPGMHPVKRYWRRGLNKARRAAARLVAPLSRAPGNIDRYFAWLACNAPNARALNALHEGLLTRRGRLPRISVIMPVYNTPAELLDQAIESISKQIYQDWELCIADDDSSDPCVAPALARWAAADHRIRVTKRGRNGGIAAATNSAAALATGEFLAFVDHDDLLTADALAEVAIFAADSPQSDIIYSDDDKIDMNGLRFAPQFKPDWSPTLLLSYMYLAHLLVARRSLFVKVGGIRAGFDGSQDYDFALRACEQARHIGHIPRILYHWRVVPGSTAASTDTKPESLTAGERAVRDAFARRSADAVVAQPGWARAAKVGIFAASFPDDGPRVAILIPTRNRVELLRTCIGSLRKTTYRNYEVVILDNDSDDPEALNFLSDCGHRVLRVSVPGGTFSFAHINNVGVSAVSAEYVLLLNNDTEVIEPRWLSQMVGYATMSGVGAVGAKLLFRDGTVQHGGIVTGYHDATAGHAFKNMPADSEGYLWYLKVARECAGVTAACLLTPRALFLEQGGLNEKAFSVAYNDVDYCYRLANCGYRCVMCPDATLYHDEGKSRGFGDNPAELAELRRRYRGRTDPYYNPNLSLDNEHFEIRPYRHGLADGTPVRLVAVSHGLNHEGAPNSQLEMILGLQRRGVIDPIVLSPRDGPLRSAYEAAGIPVQIISPPDTSGADSFNFAIGDIARAMRESGVEVVYGNTLQTFWAIAAAQAAGLPAVWNVRESEDCATYFDYLVPDLRTIAYESFGYPYRVVFVAHATRRGWEPLNNWHNFTVIHNGLDIERISVRSSTYDRAEARARLKIAAAELALVLMGTVCERKGQLDLVRALGLLGEESASRLRVFIVGDRASDYSSQLHAEARNLAPSLAARLAIVPETGEPYEYFKAADIAVCCSRIESYPRVTLEAMAFGLPLITTPVFGIAEQVRENLNGLFYRPGDARQLATYLASLASDDTLRARLSANSPLVLESLPGFADMLDGYGRLFREARLSGGGQSTASEAAIEAPGLSRCAG
jgi:GT2 family glycosyltransferase/glycosyltransferase involved in cell wall biosynthesis